MSLRHAFETCLEDALKKMSTRHLQDVLETKIMFTRKESISVSKKSISSQFKANQDKSKMHLLELNIFSTLNINTFTMNVALKIKLNEIPAIYYYMHPICWAKMAHSFAPKGPVMEISYISLLSAMTIHYH